MKKDEWVAAALFDDSVVADLLSRLKQSSSSSSSSSFSCQPLPLPPPAWGHRQPRSKPATTTTTTTTIHNKIDSSSIPNTTRCSPTTPLSWSAGSASLSDGAYDDSSNPPVSTSSSSDPSRSNKGAFAVDTANNKYKTSSSSSSKKKTFAELKEEEHLLLNERVTLKRELASLHVTLNHQKTTSRNLKRFKIDLRTPGPEMCLTTVERRQVVVPNEFCSQNRRVPTSDLHAHPSIPSLAPAVPHNGLLSSGSTTTGSSRVEKGGVDFHRSCFVVPDLNMPPSEQEFGP